jgi:hypothetical protein
VTECKCDPPADRITMAMDQDGRCRVIFRVGAEVGSDALASALDKAHQEVGGITGQATDASYHDRKCEHGRDFTEVVVFAVSSAELAGEPPAMSAPRSRSGPQSLPPGPRPLST